MADFLPQTVLNVNYGRQGRAVFQLTTPLHFVCWWVVQNTCAQSPLVKQWQRGILFPVLDHWLGPWWWDEGCWELPFSFFPRDQSWFNENLPFHQRNHWSSKDQNLSGKIQCITINSLARTEFPDMWRRGYGFIKRILLWGGFSSNFQIA